MIRPRGGNFVYNNTEFEKMVSDIRFCRENGIKEIVTGILTKEGNLDKRKLEILGSFAEPMKITIHKCIDETEDPILEIKMLSSIPQITSVLSSGKEETAVKGAHLLKEMVSTFKGEYTIIPAGKITSTNLPEVHELIGAREYHGKTII